MIKDRFRPANVEISCFLPERPWTTLAAIDDPDIGGCAKYYGAKRCFGGDPEDKRWFTKCAVDEIDALTTVLRKIGAVQIEVNYPQ